MLNKCTLFLKHLSFWRCQVLLTIPLNYPIPGSVKEAINKLRENNVKAFVLDLQNNRFLPADFGVPFHLIMLKF